MFMYNMHRDREFPMKTNNLAALFLELFESPSYYQCRENKGADQLHGYHEADLRLCFRPSILLVFLCSGSDYIVDPTAALLCKHFCCSLLT